MSLSFYGSGIQARSLAQCLYLKMSHILPARCGSGCHLRDNILLSSLTWLLTESSCSQAVGRRALAPHELLTWSLSQFLAHGLGSSQHGCWLPSEQANTAKEGTHDGTVFSLQANLRSYIPYICHIPCVRNKSPLSGRGLHNGHEYQEVGITECSLRALPISIWKAKTFTMSFWLFLSFLQQIFEYLFCAEHCTKALRIYWRTETCLCFREVDNLAGETDIKETRQIIIELKLWQVLWRTSTWCTIAGRMWAFQDSCKASLRKGARLRPRRRKHWSARKENRGLDTKEWTIGRLSGQTYPAHGGLNKWRDGGRMVS